MNDTVRADAEHVLAFLEDVNREEGRGIVEDTTLAAMRRVVAALDQTPRAVVLSWSAGTPSNAPLTVSGPPQLVTTRSYMVPADAH